MCKRHTPRFPGLVPACGVRAVLSLLLLVAPRAVPAPVALFLEGEHAPTGAIWLDALDVAHARQDWGQPRAGRSVGQNEMRLGGTRYLHGLGTHAFSECHIELHGGTNRFVAMVGIDDEAGPNGSAIFELWADDSLRWRSPVLRGGDTPLLADVKLESASRLTLIVDPTEDGIHLDHADWAGALLFLDPNASEPPRIVAPPPVETPEIACRQPQAPEINAPRVLGATPGRPFLFRIPCGGELPISATARGLPPGLTVNADTGIITGVLEKAGLWTLKLRARNKHGGSRQTMLLVAAPYSLALTPPMGWNSWNAWGETVDDAKVRAAADALLASRLADYGFQYVCIDDGWAGGRQANGAIIPNDKFPDMPGLVRYLHNAGLKAGIYASPGRTTCAGYEGSYEHEFQDARTFAAWGMDLLKYDWCSYSGVADGQGPEMFMRPYRLMRQAIDDGGRDMVYAICQYGEANVWQWAAHPDIQGNLWRTSRDIDDTWPGMLHNALAAAEATRFARPGHWSDADMMVLGKLGWGKELRNTQLNEREQQTHVTLWALLPSPMFLGCDVSQLDSFTLALLKNPEVIAIHQDPLGAPVRRVLPANDPSTEVWIRPLWDGTRAVGLFNFDPRTGPRRVYVSWAGAGLPPGPHPVRDLWRRKDLGEYTEAFALNVPARGCVLLKIGVPMKDAAAMAVLRRRYEGSCPAGGPTCPALR
ncbi:MAG TPA: NPCBM/NEW2 domain-containing protein [Candidatus Hydrogenedentes bacterium]|nr:NPCBM/NEW2 domain-containing protein [Candidatus Hydrogenedentota bacterium]